MKIQFLSVSLMFFISACTSVPEVATAPSSEQMERLAQEVNDEVVVGRQMAAKLLGHFGIFQGTAQIEQYVQLVGLTMANRVGRPEIKFRFGILKDADVNAFAAPGGYIFITSGLIEAVRDESELAGVLAHEIAHVNERHMADEILPKRDPSAASVAVSFISRGRSTLGISLSSVVNRGMELLLDQGLGEAREIEADTAAIAYTAACGYNPRGLVNFLERVSGAKFSQKSRPSANRLVQLKLKVEAEGVLNRSSGDEGVMSKRFQIATASVHP